MFSQGDAAGPSSRGKDVRLVEETQALADAHCSAQPADTFPTPDCVDADAAEARGLSGGQ